MISEQLVPKEREYYTYKCKNCGFDNRKRQILGSDVPVTRTGNYGSEGSPQPVEFEDQMYEATTVSFVAGIGSTPAYIADSASQFFDKGFKSSMRIRISTDSGTNDGDYTIRALGVSKGEILITESLTDESAATAGTVSIGRLIYKPNVTSGCPLCGTLNSR